MLQEPNRTPEPESKPFTVMSRARKAPPPATSHLELMATAKAIGFPGAICLTYTQIERELLAYLDREN